MHIYFSGIGGTAIGPLALIAKQAGYQVSGSDKQNNLYVEYLKKHGLDNIHIGQDYDQIAQVHAVNPIDWYVYSSAVAIEQPDAPELHFCREQNIKTTKRDELLNKIIEEKQLKLLAVAGTHGKTTTTAMLIWLFKELGLPLSYSVGAKISFGDMGTYANNSEYFAYECDEFDRNFLAFQPFRSLITGVTWDHHEIFKTRQDYQQAFRDFIGQSQLTNIWPKDQEYLELDPVNSKLQLLTPETKDLNAISLPGITNKEDAYLAIQTVQELSGEPYEKLVEIINRFPGLQRRMEQIAPGLYSDYAHTPEKIRGGLSVAFDIAMVAGKKVVVVYEPLTDRRQHYMLDDYKDCFNGVSRLYWIPSYLAREDPSQPVLSPSELITHLSDPSIAVAKQQDEELQQIIQHHLDEGDMVVCMTGGGGGSLDEWLRNNFQ